MSVNVLVKYPGAVKLITESGAPAPCEQSE